MSVITFLSDFGADSHYLASFRGALQKSGLNLEFIEITSRIEPFDIVEAAYISAMVYQDFAPGSLHVLATNVVATTFEGHLAAKYNGHYFLAPDNGILSLIFGPDFNDYYRIPTDRYEVKIQNVYIPFLAELMKSDMQLDQVAKKMDEVHTKARINPVRDGKELRGTVLFVDHFGNAYTNISQEEFESFTDHSPYRINLSRHSSVNRVSNTFAEVQEGEPLCFFSDNGFLVVAIKKSNAQKLLNLRKYKPLIIEKI